MPLVASVTSSPVRFPASQRGPRAIVWASRLRRNADFTAADAR